jgi:hypothetical protein
MSFGKGNTTFLMVVGLALIGVASLSACQQSRVGPSPTILVQDAAGSLVVLTPEATSAQLPKTSANVSTAAPVQLYSNSDPGPAKVVATAPSTGRVGLTGPDGKVYGHGRPPDRTARAASRMRCGRRR